MNTEVFHHINWLAVLVAGLAYFFLGALGIPRCLEKNGSPITAR